MSEEKRVPLVLTAEELQKALRCCVTNSNDGGGCRNCPMKGWSSKVDCDEQICLMAADRIRELSEEAAKLRNATEGVCWREQERMVWLAGEANAALDRGLIGVNKEHFAAMLGCQERLSEMDRDSAIRTEPVGEKGWRILGVALEGRCIYGAMEQAGDDGGGSGG